ncbi:hypothetical protein EVAR_57022_1 [Eumeta japonica]|uniref:Uncharacterized protein n=1 Tax=Eumeta variegata TaxID=151549 RepID=A0A4C2A9R3_EUMVA|nr:hypothetical protein EVAR_57022_1 [Eumeta japonica]
MPESYDTAMRRLRSMEKKLSKNDNLKREYCEQINNLLKMVRRASAESIYIRTLVTGPRSGVGRHQNVPAGQNQKEDRDSYDSCGEITCNENPQEYRNDVTDFGAASSFCTAIYIKNRNASEFELEYPEACKAIRLDHYVDDLKSFNSIEEARRVSKQVYEIHRKAASSYAVGRVTKLKS